MILLWLAVLFVGLECYTAFSCWWIDRHNPLIRTFQAGQSIHSVRQSRSTEGSAVLPSVQVEEVPWFFPDAPPPSNAPPSAPQGKGPGKSVWPCLADWEVHNVDESREERAKRRALFPLLTDQDKDFFAISHNETVVVFDHNAHPLRVYGNSVIAHSVRRLLTTFAGAVSRAVSMRRQAAQARETLARALQTGTPQYEEITFGRSDKAGLSFEIFVLPWRSPDRPEPEVYCFYCYDQLMKKLRGMNSPDSPWDIPFFRYKKNLRDSYSGLGQGFSTNNFGLRDDDVVIPKPRGVFRIICIGGSTTEEGADNATTYPNRLERRLNAHFPGRTIGVVNCGISGMASQAHLLKLSDYLRLEPDLAVVYLGINDITNDCVDLALQEARPWRRILRMSRFARLHLNRLLYPPSQEIREGLDSLTVSNLAAMLDILKKRNIRVALCSFAYPDRAAMEKREEQFFDYDLRTRWTEGTLTYKTYCEMMRICNESIVGLCKRKRICYIPVAELLNAHLAYFSDTCHMTEAGIERKAAVIFECLKDYIAPAVRETAPESAGHARAADPFSKGIPLRPK